MFVWDNGLRLRKNGLAVDFTRRQACGFVSHAHSDHIGRHQMALCTAETGSLYVHRLGKREYREMRYFEPLEWGGLKLTAYPAGHCLGSAMLLAEDSETGDSLLYTGDFKLGPSATSVEAVLPRASQLVMECTFGTPKYRMPPREKVIEEFLSFIDQSFDSGNLPVVYAYSLGKSQEITKILTAAGHKVQQQKNIYEISRIYESHGMNLGDFTLFEESGEPDPGRVLLIPPGRNFQLPPKMRPVTFTLSGWAIESGAKYRFGVDYALPLSDHADFDDLIAAARKVDPEVIYCTHGPDVFFERLLDLGFNARPIDRPWQRRLF